MKTNALLTTRSLLMISTATLIGLFLNTSAIAADYEAQCFNDVQGKIPWNDDKDMNWEAENVKQLCEGTSKPAEPGKCFLMVKSGQVNWGKGANWEWKNIINLCSGTSDAEKTVECFNKGVSAGADWRDAILMCQRSLSSKMKNNQLDWNK